jgi:hypothetical protein
VNYTVVINFNDGINDYNLPHVFAVSDPKEGMKATVIEGKRGDGSIIIPGGKRSQEIVIRGRLIDNDGYADIVTLMNEMRTKVTTNVATLTMKHLNPLYGESGEDEYIIDWTYTVRRINEINFPESLRTHEQEYEVGFLVISY